MVVAGDGLAVDKDAAIVKQLLETAATHSGVCIYQVLQQHWLGRML